MHDLRYTCLLPDLEFPAPEPGHLVEYPDDGLLARTEERVADYCGLPDACVLATCGVSEGLEVASRLWTDAVSLVLQPHVYLIDRAVRFATGRRPLALDWRDVADDAELVDRVARTARRHGRILLWLVCPNNPTGESVALDTVAALLEIPEVAVVADESYFELTGWTAIDALPEATNLLILRSFSKAFGLPGIRCGYLLASPAYHAELRELREPFRVAGPSLIYALSALEQRDRLAPQWRAAVATRRALAEALDTPALEVVASVANFVTVRAPSERAAREIAASARRRGIRMLGGWDVEFIGLSHDHLRLAVRQALPPPELASLAASIVELAEKAADGD